MPVIGSGKRLWRRPPTGGRCRCCNLLAPSSRGDPGPGCGSPLAPFLGAAPSQVVKALRVIIVGGTGLRDGSRVRNGMLEGGASPPWTNNPPDGALRLG